MNEMSFIIFIQCLGLAALALCVLRYVYNDIKVMLRAHSASNMLFGVQMMLTGNISGAIMCLTAGLRSFLFTVGLPDRYKPYIIIALVPMSLGFGLYHASNILDVVVVLTVFPIVYAEFKACEKQYRIINLFMALPWIIYGVYVGSIGLFIASLFACVSCIVALIRYDCPHLLPKIPLLKRLA
jgi:hypothetical protein